MNWLQRQRRRARDRREVDDAVTAQLRAFVASRSAVEAWIEEPTGFNAASLVLVAGDGEWIRRPVPSTQWAREFCARVQIPAFPAGVVPYPQRMRDAAQRAQIRRRREA